MSVQHLELGALAASELEEMVVALGHPRYRAAQIRQRALAGRASSIEEIATLPAALRQELGQRLCFQSLELVTELPSDRGLTRKLLLRAHDRKEIETVLIHHPGGRGTGTRTTVCVSCQVGCAIGCVFCATGQLGLRRNLSAAEIVDQVRLAGRLSAEAGWGAPGNVVFMGMGEPLHNYQAVVQAIRLLKEWGVSPRRVVVSTSGLVPEIDRLAGEALPARLAISLHATRDQLRDRLVPLNRRYPLAPLLAAARRYQAASGRRVSLEYVLIAGINDSEDDARQLRQLAEAGRAHVNLIPMNRIPNSSLGAPSEAACRRFAELVGSRSSIRFSRGGRSSAGCGQLRATLEALPRRSALAATAATDLAGS